MARMVYTWYIGSGPDDMTTPSMGQLRGWSTAYACMLDVDYNILILYLMSRNNIETCSRFRALNFLYGVTASQCFQNSMRGKFPLK